MYTYGSALKISSHFCSPVSKEIDCKKTFLGIADSSILLFNPANWLSLIQRYFATYRSLPCKIQLHSCCLTLAEHQGVHRETEEKSYLLVQIITSDLGY